jgi:hypothetical protein
MRKKMRKKKKKNNISYQVATALVAVNKCAGNATDDETTEDRVQNLLRQGPYGAYVVDGDPSGWGHGKVLATIYMEQKGGHNDCGVPLDYHGHGGEHACRASQLLDGMYIDFVNAAVACVYPL